MPRIKKLIVEKVLTDEIISEVVKQVEKKALEIENKN